MKANLSAILFFVLFLASCDFIYSGKYGIEKGRIGNDEIITKSDEVTDPDFTLVRKNKNKLFNWAAIDIMMLDEDKDTRKKSLVLHFTTDYVTYHYRNRKADVTEAEFIRWWDEKEEFYNAFSKNAFIVFKEYPFIDSVEITVNYFDDLYSAKFTRSQWEEFYGTSVANAVKNEKAFGNAQFTVKNGKAFYKNFK